MKNAKVSLVLMLTMVLILGFNPSEMFSKPKHQKEPTNQSNKALSGDDYNSKVIAKVGSENITIGELERAFKKNMNRKDAKIYEVSKDSLDDFLNLYCNYRLKVQDALARGFDKDSSVMADIAQNRRILAESWYYDKKLVEPMVEKLLKMRDKEMKFAFIRVKKHDATKTDTNESYMKAMKILDQVKAGGDFKEIANMNSPKGEGDEGGAQDGGEVPNWVTAGKLQRPFENALYAINPGEVYPNLVITNDGYFILKLLRSEPRLQVKASHILIAEGSTRDSVESEKKADSLLALLKKGANFADLAEANSDDPATAMHGGELGSWYSRSSGLEGGMKFLPKDFEDALFSLKDGQYSGLVKTDYGIHIIKRDSTRHFDVDQDRDDIKKAYKRYYFEFDKRDLLDSLRKTFGYVLNTDVMHSFLSNLDTLKTTIDSAWWRKIPENLESKILFKLEHKNTSVHDFVQTMKSKPEFRGISLNTEGMKNAIDKITDPEVFDMATENLESEYPEFAALMKEFRDGILLFRVEATEVWDKLKFDSVLAKEYYDTTKQRYWTQPTYDLDEIYVLSDSLAKSIYSEAKGSEDFEKLAEKYTQRAGFREKKGKWGKVSIKDNKLAQLVDSKKPNVGDVMEPMKFEKGYSIVKVMGYEQKRLKTFEEAISDFAPEFQDLMQKNLTDKWLTKLKKKFEVKIDYAELDKAMQEMRKEN